MTKSHKNIANRTINSNKKNPLPFLPISEKNTNHTNKNYRPLQIDAADKQRKATLNFLDEQAAEREQERDEFTKEIERLKTQLRDKDKERQMHERIAKEVRSNLFIGTKRKRKNR